MPILFLLAGLLAPALPWAPLVSLPLRAILRWRTPDDPFLDRWREVSPWRARMIVTGKLAIGVALDTLAMLVGNWLRGMF